MINIADFSKTADMYRACWSLENHDAPLVIVGARKDGAKFKERPEISLEERWTNTDLIIERARESMENTYYGGASYPILWPNLGPDIFGAIMGCDIEFGENTVWAHPINCELEELKTDSFNRENKWYKKLISMTKQIAQDANGDYIVGITDLHGGMDAMVSLRGPETLCIDMVEEPELVQKLCVDSFKPFKEIYNELNQIICAKQRGTTNWMSAYHEDGWYVSSCDLICMVSTPMFRDFVLPELKMELELYQNSIFHLDGPGALHHVDDLLSLKGINGIQWVYGAGQPTAAHWIELLQKIQAAGKMIHIEATHSDLKVMKQHLKPEGLIISTGASSETEAREIESFVKNWRKS